MKKIALLFGIALGLGLMSCDDMLPNPEPVVNPELDLFAGSDLAIEQVGNATTPLQLQALADAGERVPLAKITKLENFPSTYDLVFHVEVSTTPDFEKTGEFTAAIDDAENIVAAASTINSVITDNFTKDPAQIKIYTRFAAYAVQGTSSMRLGGENFNYGAYEYTVDPMTPAVSLSKDYYIFTREIGATTWTSMPLNKNNASASVYDDGVFTGLIEVPQGGAQWSIGADAATPDYALTPSAPEALSGSLAVGELVPATIPSMGKYLVTVDVVKNTYSVALAFDFLYVPGNATSLSDFNSVLKLFPNETFSTYSGTMRLYNAYWLTAQPSNEGVVYMRDGELTENPDGSATGLLELVDKKNDNTFMATNGLYYLEMNVADLKLKIVPIPSIQVIGDFNDWNLETAPDLAPASRFRTWTVKDVELTEGQGFKFCVNNDWAYSFGGAYDNLVQNGGNLTAEKTGKFDITIDFSKQPNTVTMVKK